MMDKEKNKATSSSPCKSGNHMKLIVPSLSVNESFVRSAVAAFCAQADPTTAELADVKCAVSEAVTNCIVHAYRDVVGQIYIDAELYDGNQLKLRIRDRGCGIENLAMAQTPLYTTDKEGERSGMVFTVMESFMDKMRVRSSVGKGTTVLLYKRLKGRDADT